MEANRDTKLIFKIARVQNTRALIKKLESYFSEFRKTDFPGRVLTDEYWRHKGKLKEERENLREVERELAKYRLRIRPKKKVKVL